MTSGTWNASCNHFVNWNGTKCPRCKLGRRPSSRVQIKFFSFLVRGDDFIQLSAREEQASSQERMRLRFCALFDAFDQPFVDFRASEFFHQFLVIDFPIGAGGDVPRRDDLLFVLFFSSSSSSARSVVIPSRLRVPPRLVVVVVVVVAVARG